MKRILQATILLASIALLGQGCAVINLTQEPETAGLVKASGPAVYYRAGDGKRYVFPNERIFFSWYQDFSGVETVSDGALALLQIGGNVTYKPGVKLVKIQTDPRVYAVGAGGLLRWITSEQLARDLYGISWSEEVHDISDSLFADYEIGSPISTLGDYNRLDSYYRDLSIAGNLKSVDRSELPDDLIIYPNSDIIGMGHYAATQATPDNVLTAEELLEEDDTTVYGYSFRTSDTTSTVGAWFEDRLTQRGYVQQENNILLRSLMKGGFRNFSKEITSEEQAVISVTPHDENSFTVSYGVGPTLPPFPGIVPVYPGTDELVKKVDEEKNTAIFVGFSFDNASNIFVWYQGQLSSHSWVELRQEDVDDQIVRVYERQVSGQIMNLKLFIAPISGEDAVGDYQAALFVEYGPADLPQFVPASEPNPFIGLF